MPLQYQRANSSPLARVFSIALLAITLAGAQMVGVAHRIEHPPGWDAHLALLQHDDHAHDHDGGPAPEHDCSAYDAATLGEGLPVAHSEPAAAAAPQPAPAARINAVADNSPHLPFHARAPPHA